MASRLVLITAAVGGVGLAAVAKLVARGYRILMAVNKAVLPRQSVAALPRARLLPWRSITSPAPLHQSLLDGSAD